jgi:hypothetical protein
MHNFNNRHSEYFYILFKCIREHIIINAFFICEHVNYKIFKKKTNFKDEKRKKINDFDYFKNFHYYII